MPGTEDGRRPFFSPDGKWVGFTTRRNLKKVPAEGGTSVEIRRRGLGRGCLGHRRNHHLHARLQKWALAPPARRRETRAGHHTRQHEGRTRPLVASVSPRSETRDLHQLLNSHRAGQDRGGGPQDRSAESPGGRRYIRPLCRDRPPALRAEGTPLLASPFDADHLITTGSAVPVVPDVAMVSIERDCRLHRLGEREPRLCAGIDDVGSYAARVGGQERERDFPETAAGCV